MKKHIILLISLIVVLAGCGRFKEYNKTISIDNNDIDISIYSTNKDKAQKAINDIETIYKKYNELLLDYNSKEKLTINENLQKIISVGELFKEYNNYIKFKPKINNNSVVKNNADINFYINGLANQEIYEYLKSKGISKFKISSSQFVLTGLPSGKDYYNIVLSSPFDDSIIKLLKSKNEYMVTKNINDPDFNNSNFNKNTENVSVTVISNDISNTDYITSLLLMMPVDEGKKVAKKYDVDVIWCYTTNGKEKIEYTDRLK